MERCSDIVRNRVNFNENTISIIIINILFTLFRWIIDISLLRVLLSVIYSTCFFYIFKSSHYVIAP